jgi:hypothetical protein
MSWCVDHCQSLTAKSNILQEGLKPTQVKGSHSKDRLLAFLAAVKLLWKLLTVAKDLAYYDMELTAVKMFILQVPRA